MKRTIWQDKPSEETPIDSDNLNSITNLGGIVMKEEKASNILLKNIANLFKVKTILSLLVIVTICVLTYKGLVSVEAFTAIAGSIITYYFNKREANDTNEKGGD